MEQKYINIFWSHVQKTESCWIWKASVGSHGYGNSWDGRKVETAPRVSWKIHFGEIPKGMYVCHHCDNRKCVNPAHLFLGSPSDNYRDMANKGRLVSTPSYGEKNGLSKLTWKQVDQIRSIWNSEKPKHRKARKYTSRRLADLFGVTKGVILSILHNEIWKKENKPH